MGRQRKKTSRWFGLGLLILVSMTGVLSLWWSGTWAQPLGRATELSESNSTRLLRQSLDLYRQSQSYDGQIEVVLRYRFNGELQEERTQILFALQRPNLARLTVSRGDVQICVACDGQYIRSRIVDPLTNDFDHQFIEQPCPESISLPALLAACEYVNPARPTEIFNTLMDMPVPLQLTPMGPLLGDTTLEKLIDDAENARGIMERNSSEQLARVSLDTPAGSFEIWLDARSKRLRRISLPTEDLSASHAIERDSVALVADFIETTPHRVPQGTAFTLERNPNAKVLSRFVLPPSVNPSPMLAKKVAPFSFVGLDSQRVRSTDWRKRLAILVWFQNHPSSRAALRQVSDVHARFKHDQRLVFLAVCTEPTSSLSHRQVAHMVRSWGSELPLVRDPDASGRDIFLIQNAPTIAVVDANGVLQLVEEGVAPHLSDRLAGVINRVLGGENIADDYLKYANEQIDAYQRHVAAVSANVPRAHPRFPDATPVAAPYQPRRLLLERLWTCTELESPGNLLVTSTVGGPTVLVLDGWRQIVRLNADGTVRSRHNLELPDDGAISFIKSATDSGGRRLFAAAARLGRRVFVFDDNWKTILTYPDATQSHQGIQDLHISDLDEDGQLELYVAFAGTTGIHRVEMDGTRLWISRTADPVLSVASTSHGHLPRLLLTNRHGEIVLLEADGRSERSVMVAQRVVHQLVASNWPQPRPTVLCGVSDLSGGGQLILGLDQSLREIWSHPLPPGAYRTQVQHVTAGALLHRDGYQWLMAGPKGTVHLVSDDGKFHDTWGHGADVTGIAVVSQSPGVLLLATEKDVSAWIVKQR